MNNLLALASALSLSIAGCFNPSSPTPTPTTPTSSPNPASPTTALVVGMENSRFAGSCPGAKLDSDRMFSLISQFTSDISLLQDSAATHDSILSAMSSAIQRAGEGLFIFYYSGHGGSDPFPDTGIEETDGHDEYLCPDDIYLRDNDIWKVLSSSKARVFFIADCCHSRTIFRSPNLSLAAPPPSPRDTWSEQGPISMQCWSGCPDYTYSYGSASGGKFTNSLLRFFNNNPSISYDDLWAKIEADSSLKKFQKVQRTLMGAPFGSQQVFR